MINGKFKKGVCAACGGEIISTTAKSSSQDEILIYGKHIIGNLYGVDERILSDEELLRRLVTDLASIANMRLIEVKSWRFEDGDKGGISVIALVVESHISIHTWPKYRYATIDIYTCGKHSDVEKAFRYALLVLRPRHYTKTFVDRSCYSSLVL